MTQETEIEEGMEEKRTTTSGLRILEKLEIAPHSINTVPCLFSISQCSINKSKETEIVNALGKVVLHNKDVCEHCSIQRQLLETEKAIRWEG